MMGFGEAVRQFYGNYVNAEGRAQRSAYWWVLLYQLIIYSVLIIVVYMACLLYTSPSPRDRG